MRLTSANLQEAESLPVSVSCRTWLPATRSGWIGLPGPVRIRIATGCRQGDLHGGAYDRAGPPKRRCWPRMGPPMQEGSRTAMQIRSWTATVVLAAGASVLLGLVAWAQKTGAEQAPPEAGSQVTPNSPLGPRRHPPPAKPKVKPRICTASSSRSLSPDWGKKVAKSRSSRATGAAVSRPNASTSAQGRSAFPLQGHRAQGGGSQLHLRHHPGREKTGVPDHLPRLPRDPQGYVGRHSQRVGNPFVHLLHERTVETGQARASQPSPAVSTIRHDSPSTRPTTGQLLLSMVRRC